MAFHLSDISRSQHQRIVLICAIVISIGILLRIINLDSKPYWLDESYTLLRASSFTAQEATQKLFTGQVIQAEQVLRYQQPSEGDRGVMGTITGLATEEPQHPPLYFVLTRFWAQLFGSSKWAMRILPVIGSLLTFPAIYWLCQELFATPLVGWFTMALFAVSPMQLRYAEEVRQYSFWLALVLFASAALLRAVRQPTKLNWSIYSLLIATGIYCHLLTGLVVIAHGVYLIIQEQFRLTQAGWRYLVAAIAGLLLAMPWLWVVIQNRSIVAQTTAYSTKPLPFSSLLQSWLIFLDRTFIAAHFQYSVWLIALAIPILTLILYTFYFFCRYAPRSAKIFVLSLMATLFLPFLIPDLLWGGRRSLYDRYFLPCYIGLDIVVAYLLTVKLTQPMQQLQQQFWRVLTAFLLSGSIISCISSALAPTWWGWSEFDVKIAQIINSTAHPLLISDVPFHGVVPLTHELKPETSMILLPDPALLNIPEGVHNIFLYNPSDRLLSQVKQRGFESTLAYQFHDQLTKLNISLYQAKGQQ